MKNFRMEAAILAFGLIVLGISLHHGIAIYGERDRSVSVKGLAEMEVPADKVTLFPANSRAASRLVNAVSERTCGVAEKNRP